MTQIELHTLFDYQDGQLFWKHSRGRSKAGDTGAVAFRVRQSTAPTTTAARITNSAGSASILDAIYANVVIFR